MGVEARIAIQEHCQALHHQNRTDQEHKGKGNFRDHKDAAKARAHPTGGRTRFFFERVALTSMRDLQCRRKAESESGEDHGSAEKREDGQVGVGVAQKRRKDQK